MRHWFCISGKVASGKQLGRTLGFPTANLKYKPSQSKYGFPEHGVYLACALIRKAGKCSGRYPSIVNIGRHPTAPEGPPTIEAHLLGWPEAETLYGKRLHLLSLAFFRPEQTFPSLEALQKQLQTDRSHAYEYIRQHPDTFANWKGIDEIIHE